MIPTSSARRSQTTAKLASAAEPLPAITHALRSERSFAFDRLPVQLAFDDGILSLDGEVPSLAIKRRLVRLARAHSEVIRVKDRLCVTPETAADDADICAQLVDALTEEAAFRECTIYQRSRAVAELVREVQDARGSVYVAVEAGVVTLEGELPTRAHERLAGVLAWWVPGARDVLNDLTLTPMEPDTENELVAAVRLALEMDPFVDASQIRVDARGGVVTLRGLVWSTSERQMAENDAWYVFGVTDVENDLRAAESP